MYGVVTRVAVRWPRMFKVPEQAFASVAGERCGTLPQGGLVGHRQTLRSVGRDAVYRLRYEVDTVPAILGAGVAVAVVRGGVGVGVGAAVGVATGSGVATATKEPITSNSATARPSVPPRQSA